MSDPLKLTLDTAALRPLIVEVVRETLAQAEADRATVAGPLCYSEEEAARLLGIEPHVLRDERRRGRIQASQIACRRVRYLPADLAAYLAARRIGIEAKAA
jgi:hypothetical protein